ncbi:MAG: glycosyltransferase family 1 protein [Anaerocolumna sp.]
MKIALFADTYSPQINGVTNTLGKLVSYYEASGIDYKIFVPKYDTEQRNKKIERFYSLKFFLYPESRITFPNLFRLTQSLTEFRPDLIHLMTECNMGIAGLYYGKKHGIPTISNYTTNFSQYTNYYKINFLEQAIWNYMKWFHTQNDITLCPSYAAQDLLRSHGIYNTDIFSRGIDSENFHPMYRNPKLREGLGLENKTVFLYVGRISVEKDLNILSESYQAIHETYKDQAALVITGDGPYLKKCRSMFPDDTIFTGFKKGRELAEIYASCDIFICPSSTETFGNVVLEAMTSGLPVIGADAGGVGEIIQHRNTGLKFQSRNSEELTRCMKELMLNITLRNSLRENGRTFGTDRSWNKIFDGLVNIYQDVLMKRGLSTQSA